MTYKGLLTSQYPRPVTALQGRGSPSEDDKTTALVAQLNQIQSLDLSLLLNHHLPLSSPTQHHLYIATCKSQQVLHPPMPESTQWLADQLHPSNHIPVDNGVQGLKLAKWEQEYHRFHRALELSCCLLV